MNDTNILALFGIGLEDIERYELLKADIEITEKALRQYRREGRYFDEIVGGDNDD